MTQRGRHERESLTEMGWKWCCRSSASSCDCIESQVARGRVDAMGHGALKLLPETYGIMSICSHNTFLSPKGTGYCVRHPKVAWEQANTDRSPRDVT